MQAASPSCLPEHRTGQRELPGRRMKEMNSDTIAAVSTAMSPAGIGIVRISGTHAFEIADRIYDSGTKKKKKLSEQPGEVFLLDCMSNLLANEMYLEGGSIRRRDEEAVKECRQAIIEPLLELGRKKELVIVSNEVFSDGVLYDEETSCYLALLGEIHRQLAGEAAEVTEVVCGIPVPVKPVPNRI